MADTLVGGEGSSQLQDEDNPELIWRIEAESWEEANQSGLQLRALHHSPRRTRCASASRRLSLILLNPLVSEHEKVGYDAENRRPRGHDIGSQLFARLCWRVVPRPRRCQLLCSKL